jgi:hypothetical protein
MNIARVQQVRMSSFSTWGVLLRLDKALANAVLAAMMLIAPALGAAAVTSHGRQVRITQVYVYPDYGGGDVVAVLDDPIPGCEAGVWIGSSSPGYKVTVSTLLMLQSSGSTARVWAHDDQLWSGSSGKFCRISTLNPVRS